MVRGAWRRIDWESLSVSLLAFLVYSNTLDHGFVYDDNRAVLTNPDVLASAPLLHVFHNDFWGTPLSSSNSHGSYRPLCVLSFRLNHWLSGINPSRYHLTNILLHVLATTLVLKTAQQLLPGRAPLLAACIFAVHPIHVEAVTSVVGRADVLASVFFLISFLCFLKHVKVRDSYLLKCASSKEPVLKGKVTNRRSLAHTNNVNNKILFSVLDKLVFNVKLLPLNFKDEKYHFRMYIMFSIVSVMCKEIGLTVIPLAICYDIILLRRSQHLKSKQTITASACASSVSFLVIFLIRLYIMGFKIPDFSKADNPTAKESSFFARTVMFSYLPIFNLFLLFFPKWLSFDWSMDSVPKVSTIFDCRFLLSCLFFYGLYVTLKHVWANMSKNASKPPAKKLNCKSCSKETLDDHLVACRLTNNNNLPLSCDCKEKFTKCVQKDISLILCLAFLIIPFIPSSNLFFYVGLVVAERVLYIPSIGFCMLVALGAHFLWNNNQKILTLGGCLLLLVVFTARTLQRNKDWASEETLYRSAIHINPPKAWGNLGSVLSTQGRLDEAEVALRTALHHRPNMADVHYNLGNLLQRKHKYEDAVDSYSTAIRYRPSLAVAYLNLGHVLESLARHQESETLYRRCSLLAVTGLKDPRAHQLAQRSCFKRLRELCDKKRCSEESTGVLDDKVLEFKITMEHEDMKSSANHFKNNAAEHNNLSQQQLQNKSRLSEEEELFQRAIVKSPNDPAVFVNYGQLLVRLGKVKEAASVYVRAAQLAPEQHPLVISAAIALRQAGRLKEAEQLYRQARDLRPQDATSHSNLGAILHLLGRYREAASSYKEALRLSPKDQVTLANLQKLRNIISRNKR